MTATKKQELEALEQIRNIVEGLGEGNHIAKAFEKCFELAEHNIRTDNTISLWSQLKNAEESEFALKEQVEFALVCEKQYRDMWKDAKTELDKTQDKIAEQHHEIVELNMQVTSLKAKLYDLMTA